MAEIDYTYTPGGARLQTQGGALGGGGMPDMSWLLEIARRKADAEESRRAAEERRREEAFALQMRQAKEAMAPRERPSPAPTKGWRQTDDYLTQAPGGFGVLPHQVIDWERIQKEQALSGIRRRGEG